MPQRIWDPDREPKASVKKEESVEDYQFPSPLKYMVIGAMLMLGAVILICAGGIALAVTVYCNKKSIGR